MSSAQRTIFFTAVTVKYMKKNHDITLVLGPSLYRGFTVTEFTVQRLIRGYDLPGVNCISVLFLASPQTSFGVRSSRTHA